MNAFETFFATQSDQSAEARAIALAAWDAALCAVQRQIFDANGKISPAEKITSDICRAHSWNTTPTA